MKKVVVIGAGPGGLASATILAHRGYDVTIVEKNNHVGGRNANLHIGDFAFDTGPTFLHTPFLIQEVFAAAGENIHDHLDIVEIEPFNSIVFDDVTVNCFHDSDKMHAEIQEKFPRDEQKFHQYLKDERKVNEALGPNLKQPFTHWWHFLRPSFLRLAPHVLTTKSVYSKLGTYFRSKQLRMCMSFQTKYLGMTPWKCPAVLSILSSWEYLYGIYHVQGGLCQISESMAKIAQNKGAKLKLGHAVATTKIHKKNITHVVLENGEEIPADIVVCNADYAYSMTHLLGPKNIPKKKMNKKPMSCSVYMLYLGIDQLYTDQPHHQIIMASDYEGWTNTIHENEHLPEDMSLYVRNSSITDPYVAPAGASGIYILVPVPNQLAGHDWATIAPEFREQVLDTVEAKSNMNDLGKHIIAEHAITPDDWESQYNVYNGATFSLKHTLDQMLYFRPHNHQSRIKNLYLTGGGTHPGSGLIPIIQSAHISCDLIEKTQK